jgi:hypothetical protein
VIDRRLSEILSAEHARFDRVRAEPIAATEEAFAAWQEVDLLA